MINKTLCMSLIFCFIIPGYAAAGMVGDMTAAPSAKIDFSGAVRLGIPAGLIADLTVSPQSGDIFYITDGADNGDCSTGWGNSSHICVYSGASWTAAVTSAEINDWITNNPAVAANTAKVSATGLEKITEGTNPGWRLIGADPANYGILGDGAVDFSQSPSISATKGATGIASFAAGFQTVASGQSSFSIGDGSKASGDHSASFGNNTIASGIYSDAFGYFTQATGASSVAGGNYTVASGDYSVALGTNTISQNTGSFSIGSYNLGTSLDTIFEIGIGASGTRINGFELYTDGTATLPDASTAEIDARGDTAIATREYVRTTSVLTETDPVYTAWYAGFDADVAGTPSVTANTTGVGNLVTLSGAPSGSTDNGTFSGTTIPDNTTTKNALAALETAVELRGTNTTTMNIYTADDCSVISGMAVGDLCFEY